MLLHRRKITVVVQQCAPAFDAKRADDDVGGFADRYTQVPQLGIIPCGARGEVAIEKRHDIEPAQHAFGARRRGLVRALFEELRAE